MSANGDFAASVNLWPLAMLAAGRDGAALKALGVMAVYDIGGAAAIRAQCSQGSR